MKNKHFYIRIFLVIFTFLISLFFYNDLPLQIPTHYDINGKIDGYTPKNIFMFVFPLIILIGVIFMNLTKRLDPKSENYEKFGKYWNFLQYIILIFLLYFYILIIYFAINPSSNITLFVLGGVGFLFILIGNYMGKIKQNYFIGFKLPWALENEKIWNKTHRLGGKLYVLSGILTLISCFFNSYPFFVFFISLISSTIFTIIYSYLEFKKIKK